jgi:hypothetical protein
MEEAMAGGWLTGPCRKTSGMSTPNTCFYLTAKDFKLLRSREVAQRCPLWLNAQTGQSLLINEKRTYAMINLSGMCLATSFRDKF